MFRDSSLPTHRCGDDAADSAEYRPGMRAVGRVDDRPSLLLIGGEDQRAELAAIARGMDFRLMGGVSLAEAGSRLGQTVALDALVLDARGVGACDLDFDRAIHAVLAWPGSSDGQLVVLADLATLDSVVAAIGIANATILCEPAPADLVTALWVIARDRRDIAHLHDVSRDPESARLEQLSEEVRRLAQTIDRLAQGGGQEDASRLRDAQLAFAAPPESIGAGLARRPAARGGTGGVISRDEVRGLLQARRLRDRYLPPDLFADPAWDMILDLMAARLAGKRVSVSSLCIAAAVPPTTALRWIGQLTERGIFVRANDPADARRVFITISDEAAENVAAWFAATRRAGLRFGG